MSTKRLARTVIEGGRSHANTFFRRNSHRVHRRQERQYLRALELDPELAESVPPPERESVRRWHYDRLSAAERWLAARAGRPWRAVEGEILAAFDTRSIAGRHIVYDHLLPPRWRQDPRGVWWVSRRFLFWVDDEGLLVAERRKRQRTPWHWKRRLIDLAEAPISCRAASFAGEDRIGLRDHHAYWLHPATARFSKIERRRQRARELRYAQGRPLTDAERTTYDALTPDDRIAITIVLEGSAPG